MVVDGVARFGTMLANMVVKANELYNRAVDVVRPIINWIDANQDMFRLIREYIEAREEAQKVLRGYKWFLTPSISEKFVAELIVAAHQKGHKRGSVSRLYVRYFTTKRCANLRAMLDIWGSNSLFEPRMKILRDTVSTVSRLYGTSVNVSNVVLPTLISQIDGIQTNYMLSKGFTVQRGKWKDPQGKQMPDFEGAWSTAIDTRSLDLFSLGMANEVFLDVLFQKAYPGQPLQSPFTFSRHKIMHGEYTNYGRMENVIRAFLTLDFLCYLQ